MPPIIKVENVSKMYRLGEVGTGTLRDDLARTWAKLRGKEDPFQKVGHTNRREEAADGDHDYVWALQDVNFEVEPGEILGIIGRNGAGKSTLLKLLSRITAPTTGRIRARGRIASLLEVGTGFHPELTGRENIYLNGALLGMTRREVAHRLEEIVEFSGCAKYIDTPVKRYSSGMMVRLGFSVAAHLECEVLIVDEVLAVGDAEFQKRCLGKMSDVAGDGRTILFVSHNMASVATLCQRSILLTDGYVNRDGPTSDIIAGYFSSEASEEARICWPEGYANEGETDLLFQELRVTDANGNETTHFGTSQDLHLELTYRVARELQFCRIGIIVKNVEGQDVFDAYDTDAAFCSGRRTPGQSTVRCTIPGGVLNAGGYTITVNAGIPYVRNLVHIPNAVLLTVEDDSLGTTHGNVRRSGLVLAPTTWSELSPLETT